MTRYTEQEDEIIREEMSNGKGWNERAFQRMPHHTYVSIRHRGSMLRNLYVKKYDRYAKWSVSEDKVIMNKVKKSKHYISLIYEVLTWRSPDSIASRVKRLKKIGLI